MTVLDVLKQFVLLLSAWNTLVWNPHAEGTYCIICLFCVYAYNAVTVIRFVKR